MPRYGCFEIRTSCRSCGHSIPINGPFRRLSCTACFEDMVLSPERIADFLNDFEEEYEGLADRQGQGGTLMSGSGTFKYSYWRLKPRCSSCKAVLPLTEEPGSSSVKCTECGSVYYIFPVPEWLGKLVPSARLCFTQQPPPENNDSAGLKVNENSQKPVVMACPQCAAALSVSSGSERIMNCSYCNSEIYVPDAVWKRLYPVRKSEEWFVSFEGKNNNQLQASRRLRDQKEEEKELKTWRLRNAPKKAAGKFRPILIILGVILSLAVVVSLVLVLSGYNQKRVLGILESLLPIVLTAGAVLIPVGFVLQTLFSAKMGKGKNCKQAMTLLSEKHGWKHEGAEYSSSLGYIRAKYRGRDIEIDPGDDYAIEVDINDSPFYLNTEPPGYPHEGVRRFTSGDCRFDDLFPIRYTTPELAEKIEQSVDHAKVVLAPIYWFLDRWEKKLGRLRIDWSDAAVHLIPGHMEIMDAGGKYLLAEDLEPLLEDMTTLAAAIDAVASGREPDLTE
ncbi:MAG: hypothetical protein KAH54_00845 [Candidatus Sabulitectum sp.]|nr:hypothetical protein [Candidatus Sabulitectum sp.]